eukprot:SAG11_NODE_8732_length_981_cov_13.041950_1_plen_37_part_10
MLCVDPDEVKGLDHTELHAHLPRVRGQDYGLDERNHR